MWANSTKDDEIFNFYFHQFLHVNKILRHQINWSVKIIFSAKEWCNFNIFPLNYNKVTISQRVAVFFPSNFDSCFFTYSIFDISYQFQWNFKLPPEFKQLEQQSVHNKFGTILSNIFGDILEVVKSRKNQ